MLEYRQTPIRLPNLLPTDAIDRRTFCALTAIAVLRRSFAPGPVLAVQVASNDPRIHSGRVSIEAQWGKLDCYFARPAADTGPLPGIVVAHDKFGPTPHFEDIARRLALEGFVTIVPDYGSRFGGTPTESGPAQEIVGMAKLPDMISDTKMTVDWLQSVGTSTNQIGAVGIGLGGTTINAAVTKLPDIKAAATFYGHPPPLVDIGNIKASLLLNFAGKDQFIDPEIPGFVDALKQAGVKYELFTYENTVRGFEDDSTLAHYSPDAAKIAWSRTHEFLKMTLA